MEPEYIKIFERNIGWVTEAEQLLLSSKCIAIAGLGGVGGNHLMALVRLGVGRFHLADFDTFELANFNRQYGATISNLGQSKIAVMEKMARDVNPHLVCKIFAQGLKDTDVEDFLAGADLYVDSLDFFEIDLRCKIFAACYRKGIPAITAGPIGMGTAVMVFNPPSMSFEHYFRLEGFTQEEQYLRFLAGLTPKFLQKSYIADRTRVDLNNRKAPSIGFTCMLCAGFAAAEALKLLLKRGKVYTAPYSQQIDAYEGRWVRSYLPMGNANPWQKFKIFMIKRFLKESA